MAEIYDEGGLAFAQMIDHITAMQRGEDGKIGKHELMGDNDLSDDMQQVMFQVNRAWRQAGADTYLLTYEVEKLIDRIDKPKSRGFAVPHVSFFDVPRAICDMNQQTMTIYHNVAEGLNISFSFLVRSEEWGVYGQRFEGWIGDPLEPSPITKIHSRDLALGRLMSRKLLDVRQSSESAKSSKSKAATARYSVASMLVGQFGRVKKEYLQEKEDELERERQSATFRMGRHAVEGHLRHYKSGKVVPVKPHFRGEGPTKPKLVRTPK